MEYDIYALEKKLSKTMSDKRFYHCLGVQGTSMALAAGYEYDILLHGKLGAYYSEHRYGICDSEILTAIHWHTTGKPGMNLLEKIIFVADFIEPNRSEERIPELNDIRRLAFTDLDSAVVEILKNTLFYLEKQGQEIDNLTVAAYEYYRDK